MALSLVRLNCVKSLFIAIVLFIIAGGTVAYSSEGGGNTYTLGYFGVLTGIQPPPGEYFTEVTIDYSGNAVFETQSGEVETHTHINSFSAASIFQQVTKTRVLNSDYAWGILASVVNNDVSGQVVRPVNIPSFNASITGLGTVVLLPMALGWNNGRSHQRIALIVYTPLGNYNVKRLVSTCTNHWSYEFDYAFTFKDPKTGLEFTVVPGYTINTINRATNYRDGQELHIDFSAIKNFPTSFGFGITGYAFNQTTPDSGSGALLGAFKGRVYALGPTFVYDAKVGGETISLIGKYFQEFGAQNRFEGHSAWLYMTIAF